MPGSRPFPEPLLEGMGIAACRSQIPGRGPSDLQEGLAEVIGCDPGGLIEGKDLLPVHPAVDLGNIIEPAAPGKALLPAVGKGVPEAHIIGSGIGPQLHTGFGQLEGH